MKLYNQIENKFRHELLTRKKHWKIDNSSRRFVKSRQHKTERHRANVDPECQPCYRRYRDYEF